jgi:hypothetical protein
MNILNISRTVSFQIFRLTTATKRNGNEISGEKTKIKINETNSLENHLEEKKMENNNNLSIEATEHEKEKNKK